MCSVMGCCATSATLKGFEKTVSKGIDDSIQLIREKLSSAFTVQPITGLHPKGMQPFCLEKRYLICNVC